MFEYVPPGPRAKAYLEKRRSARHGRLSDLKVVDGICKWCEPAPVKSKQSGFRLYCGRDCSESAAASMSPQKPTAKAYILIVRQSAACARCKEDFSEQLDAIIWKNLTHWIDDLKIRPVRDDDTIDLWVLGRDNGHIWQVDHIVPIHKGGIGVGLDNVQVLCVDCHHRKTAEDRRSESA